MHLFDPPYSIGPFKFLNSLESQRFRKTWGLLFSCRIIDHHQINCGYHHLGEKVFFVCLKVYGKCYEQTKHTIYQLNRIDYNRGRNSYMRQQLNLIRHSIPLKPACYLFFFPSKTPRWYTYVTNWFGDILHLNSSQGNLCNELKCTCNWIGVLPSALSASRRLYLKNRITESCQLVRLIIIGTLRTEGDRAILCHFKSIEPSILKIQRNEAHYFKLQERVRSLDAVTPHTCWVTWGSWSSRFLTSNAVLDSRN